MFIAFFGVIVFFHYSVSAQVSTDKLIAFYPFNGNANDESGNGNNGTAYGATLTTDRFGDPNHAYYFDGENDYILVPNSTILQISGPITMSAWFKTDYAKPFADIICKAEKVEPRHGYLMDINEYGKARADIWYNHQNDQGGYVVSTDKVVDNKWHFMVATYDGQIFKLYVDGKFNAELNYTDGMRINSDPLLIGWDQNPWLSDRFFRGKIDEVMIYNRILSPDEVEEMYDIDKSRITGSHIVCQGLTGESYSVFGMDGTSAYSWNYSGTGVSINGSSSNVHLNFGVNATGGNLIVIGNRGGKADTAKYHITVNPAPIAIASTNSPVCAGNSINLIAHSVPGASYLWRGPNGYSSVEQYSEIFSSTPQDSGVYSLTVSANGCTSPPKNVYIQIQNCVNTGTNTDLSVLKLVDDVSPEIGQTVVFTVKAINNGPFDASGIMVSDVMPGGYTLVSAEPTLGNYDTISGEWNIGSMVSGESQTLTVTATVNSSGFYQNTAIIQGSVNEVNILNNISSALTVPWVPEVPNPDPGDINIPNAFSPNGDNINDLFVIRGLRENSVLIVFDRLGRKVFESENYMSDWDGRDLNGEKLNSDTYWYVLRIPGMPMDFKGFIYLKR